MVKLRKFFAFLFFVFIAGCAKYNPRPLSVPDVESAQADRSSVEFANNDLSGIVELDEEDIKKNIKPCNNQTLIVEARALSEAECRFHFSRKIISKGYHPVQLFVKNMGKEEYVLDTSSVNLPLESRLIVADKLHLNAGRRVVGWCLAGFIPAVVEYVKVSNANQALDKDFNDRVLDANSKYKIKPGGSLNKVFFVKEEEFNNMLKLKLTSSKSNKVRDFGFIL